MKHWILISALLMLFFSGSAEANIASSKHNLSAGGTGTIKATAETELCIFCHIPHNAKPEAPLWNREVTTAAYTMYNSDYLTRAGYTTPTDVGQRSRLCLSCHDGTVAVGSVYALRGARNATIGMSGVDATGKMQSTATGYLGTDLRNDHPVSIKYDTGPFTTIGLRGMELKTPAPPINPKPYQGVKLYGAVSGTIQGYVECTSCHDPHNDVNAKMLVVSNTGGALCIACHNKAGWAGSAHQTSVVAVNNPAGETQPIPAGTIAQAACMSCHKTHSGGGVPYLTRKIEENTCFSPANAGTLPTATSCHGTNTTVAKNNIQSVLGRARSHPTTTTSGVHKNLDVLDYTLLDTGNRHAECADCHNPHQAKNLPRRVAANSWYPSTVSATSNLTSNSGALAGVPGVTPGAAAMWTARTTFTTQEAATYEYEICYKCHSYFTIRNATTPLSAWTGPSLATITDQAWEFNPANRSGHPVEVTLASRSGSTTPKALEASQLLTPWSANRGNQTMYCSDCHGADNENSTDPSGPHGSSANFMLKGPNKTWPGTFTLGGSLTGLFCLNCHPVKSGTSFYNNAHSHEKHQTATCVRCHIEVPHGSRLSRLIAYSTPTPLWGAPYGSQSWLRGFRKAASSTGYTKPDCQTIASGSTCGSAHGNAVSGAEN